MAGCACSLLVEIGTLFYWRIKKKERIEMKTAAFIAIAGLASVASAEVLLEIDLTDPGFITITATNGLSAGSVAGSDGIGFLMASFYNDASFGAGDTLVSGDLTSAENTSDGTPDLWSYSTSFGLNVYSYTDDPDSTFTAGSVAFSGAATWAISAPEFAAMLAGNAGGDIYAIADSDAGIAGAALLGQWRVIPAPSSVALLGLGGIVAGRRRR